MSVFKPMIWYLREIPSFNTLRSMNVGYVQWDIQAFTVVLLPFLDAAPNLEEFIIFDSNPSDKNHPFFSPDFID